MLMQITIKFLIMVSVKTKKKKKKSERKMTYKLTNNLLLIKKQMKMLT